MNIGIIGAGNIGQAIATQMLRGGHTVHLANSRGPETLGEIVDGLGLGVDAVTVEKAAEQEVVFVAVPWEFIADAVKGLPDWDGRIVVDPNNAMLRPDFRPADLGGRASSVVFAELFNDAKVVKTANVLTAAILAEDPVLPEGRRVLFISGDDSDAKETVSGLFTRAGFRMIDVGDLETGSRLHQFPGGPIATSLIAPD
jgi:8-hydroxy-5-deazaflavin:NADPH oxidoreductase